MRRNVLVNRRRLVHVTETPPGLCDRCRWMRTIVSTRGSRFLRCGRADNDQSFVRYPALPVQACEGFETKRIATNMPISRSAATPIDDPIPLHDQPLARQITKPPPDT